MVVPQTLWLLRNVSYCRLPGHYINTHSLASFLPAGMASRPAARGAFQGTHTRGQLFRHSRCLAALTPWHARILGGHSTKPSSTHQGGGIGHPTRCISAAVPACSPIHYGEGDQQGPPPGTQTINVVLSQAEEAQMKRELHSLNVALGANILICIAKVWVHLISGSSAMLAEAFHSVADILNQALLRIGVLKASKMPTARHPYGYMRDRFVWSLISAVGIFFLGAGASVFHGLHTLTETRVVEGAMWSYIVLGVSVLLEGYSLMVAYRYVKAGARAKSMSFVQYIRSGVDPTTVAVLLEDGGAVAGLGIAGICTALTHFTGNAVWDAVGSIAVGGLLGLIAVFLVQKNRDLLLGRSMSNREIEEVLGHLRRDPVILYITETKTEEIGPRVFRFKADVAWDGDMLVERYLARCGRQRLAERLATALEAEKQAQRSGRATAGELDLVLKGYARDIINAVGAEVDRIEVEIQAINPGIRYVDLETDRAGYRTTKAIVGTAPNTGNSSNTGNTIRTGSTMAVAQDSFSDAQCSACGDDGECWGNGGVTGHIGSSSTGGNVSGSLGGMVQGLPASQTQPLLTLKTSTTSSAVMHHHSASLTGSLDV